jgi:hypothetical protein
MGVAITDSLELGASSTNGIAGPGTMLQGVPSLAEDESDDIVAVDGATSMRAFAVSGGSYTEAFGGTDSLTHE